MYSTTKLSKLHYEVFLADYLVELENLYYYVTFEIERFLNNFGTVFRNNIAKW